MRKSIGIPSMADTREPWWREVAGCDRSDAFLANSFIFYLFIFIVIDPVACDKICWCLI